MSRHRTDSLEQLKALATEVAAYKDARLILLLDGPMGAGKTQFTKFLLEALGSTEAVSPSFAIHNSYETTRTEIHHVDLFRLENSDDLESTGFWDLFSIDKAWVIIEWAGKLNEFGLHEQLPKAWPKIQMIFETSSGRSIELTRLS